MKPAVLFGLVFLLLVGGCFEDETVVKLNADGSGTVKERIVLSEQLMTATAQGKGPSEGPPLSKEAVLERIGSALDVKSISQKDLPDGSRVIEFEGTFSRPEQFFLSDFCVKQLKLRLSPAGKGKAAVYCVVREQQGGEIDLRRIYGMAKGMFVKRTVRLPGRIIETNGQREKGDNVVSWTFDLRNREGLEKTEAFLKAWPDAQGKVVFDASSLKFELPLKAEKSAPAAAPAEPNLTSVDPSQIKAAVSWVAVTRAIEPNGSAVPEKAQAELGIELTWSQGNRPVQCEDAVLLSLVDDTGKDLAGGSKLVSTGFQLRVNESDKNKELKLKFKAPSAGAKKLKNIEGYVEVITGEVRRTVVLDNIRDLVGKDSTGNPVLDKVGLKIKKIDDRSVTISIDAGRKRIVSFDLLKDDGSKVRTGGWGGWDQNYRYDFQEDISEVKKCRIVVITDQAKARIPFSLAEMLLP